MTEQVRHELITLAREQAPVDEVGQFVEQNHAHPPLPDTDPPKVHIFAAPFLT